MTHFLGVQAALDRFAFMAATAALGVLVALQPLAQLRKHIQASVLQSLLSLQHLPDCNELHMQMLMQLLCIAAGPPVAIAAHQHICNVESPLQDCHMSVTCMRQPIQASLAGLIRVLQIPCAPTRQLPAFHIAMTQQSSNTTVENRQSTQTVIVYLL